MKTETIESRGVRPLLNVLQVVTGEQTGPLSLVELLHCCALIGRELHALKGPIIGGLSDATPALLCHKEPARASKAPY